MAEAAADLRPALARTPAAAPTTTPAPGAQPAAAAQPPAAAPAQPEPAPQPGPQNGGSFIVVRDRFTIYCDRPIASLDMPNALAYEVADKKQEGRPLYALVCKPEMPTRISVMRILKGLEIPAVLHMVDWGVAEWPPITRKCVIVIYHRPLGGRVMESMAATFKRIPDHQFARAIIKPIADALVELSLKGIAYRSIRPDNL